MQLLSHDRIIQFFNPLQNYYFCDFNFNFNLNMSNQIFCFLKTEVLLVVDLKNTRLLISFSLEHLNRGK